MRKPRTTKTVAAPFDDERSADAVTSLTLMGLLASMLYSFPLWLNSSREYPLLPPLDWWPLLPRPVDLIALLTLVLAAVVRIFSNKLRWLSLLVAVIAVLLALQDQTRWQPWFYQYILMLVFLAAGHKFGNRQGLDACCIIMSFTYLWSGLQKVNAGFCMELVPWLFHLDPKYGIAAGIACALAEATLGIALLLQRSRKIACILLSIMHLTLVGFLYHHNWNSVVWPWNLVMCALTFSLFWRDSQRSTSAMLLPGKSAIKIAALLLFGFLPALNFIGLWDAYLSASLCSGNTLRARLQFSREQYEKLTPKAKELAEPVDDVFELDVFDWSMKDLNVASYPEPRAYQELGRIMLHRTGGDTVNLVYIKFPRFFESMPTEPPRKRTE
ncbi:MAG: hypothetical protein K2W95_18010 [Candidatus Obscuribacterales bacterium]|nr:hypothetical protein [Candidatus Obscuribacterales bacterium]